MIDLAWMILFGGIVVATDAMWTEFRGWRARRQAIRRRPTLTGKYALPPHDWTNDA